MVTVNGTLTEKITSTAASPAVHYAVSYTAVRTDVSAAAVTVGFTFTGWLNSSQSKLGTGIKLTVFVRLNGGAWQSVVLKDSGASWNGTQHHTVRLTLSAKVKADTVSVEFYVSRTGSSYGGTAGVLGSAGNPKGGSAQLPAYAATGSTAGQAGTGGTAAEQYVYVRSGNVWQKAVPYVRIGSAWKKAVPYVRVNGTWKST